MFSHKHAIGFLYLVYLFKKYKITISTLYYVLKHPYVVVHSWNSLDWRH